MTQKFVEEFEKRTGNQLPTRSKGVLSEMLKEKNDYIALLQSKLTVDYHEFTWPSMPIKLRKKFHVGPIYINALRCELCGYFIRSRNRHDYRSCDCGSCSIDGGSEYIRVSGESSNYELITVMFDELTEDEKS